MSILTSGLGKSYGSQKALDNVSFEIPDAQIVGLLGPNGAGKSTLMKILCSYIPADSGHARVGAYDVDQQSLEARRHLGYLPEHNPLYPELYVKEYLAFMAGLHYPKTAVQERVDQMIEQVGLQKEYRKTIGQLSKGYRQRVGLAQALIHDPEVLILDEPTTGLDPNQLEEIRDLIRHLGQNKTVILSTHILQEVAAVCQRFLILDHGCLVADRHTTNSSREELETLFHQLTGRPSTGSSN